MASKIEDGDDVASRGSTFEKIFIDIMVNEVKKGNMENRFSPSTYRRIVFETCKRGGRRLSPRLIKLKFCRLRNKYREFSLLLSQPGFDWDPETNTVHATEETWKKYIQANPHGEKFRTKGVAAYKSLDAIFNSSASTGIVHRAIPFTQAPLIIDEANELDNNKGYITPILRDGTTSLDGVHTFNSPYEPNVRKNQRSYEIREGLNACTNTTKTQPEVNLARPEGYRTTQSGEGSNACTDTTKTQPEVNLARPEGYRTTQSGEGSNACTDTAKPQPEVNLARSEGYGTTQSCEGLNTCTRTKTQPKVNLVRIERYGRTQSDKGLNASTNITKTQPEVNLVIPERYRTTQSGEGLNAHTDTAKAQLEVNLARPEGYRTTPSGEGSCTPSGNPYTINKCMAVLNDLEGVSDDAYSKVLKLFKDADWREMFMNIPQERMLGWLERLCG